LDCSAIEKEDKEEEEEEEEEKEKEKKKKRKINFCVQRPERLKNKVEAEAAPQLHGHV
jgi:hypothetical protein